MFTRYAAQIISDLNIHGQVINVSSIAGHRIPGTKSVFYSATKHAVRAITEGLRMEVCISVCACVKEKVSLVRLTLKTKPQNANQIDEPFFSFPKNKK